MASTSLCRNPLPPTPFPASGARGAGFGIGTETGTLLVPVLVVVLTALLAWLPGAPAEGRTTLRSICRVKGQEENTLHGMGMVVGLKGTGDGGKFLPTIRSLAIAMQLMGKPVNAAAELKDAKNVALVAVSATVPAAGARQGDRIDCVVSSVGAAKSLQGGRLFLTPLVGPEDPQHPRVYAFAEGPITLEDPNMPTTGRIHAGCRLEEDFFNPFIKDGKITLVLDKNHADFQLASDVAEWINSQLSIQMDGVALARAINQVNIEVMIPAQYRDDPVLFVSQVLATPLMDQHTSPRVVINERAGSIVISGDVEIGAVVVTHKNVVVETGAQAAAGRFVPLDPEKTETPKLKALVEALNAVNVPTEDIIDIIKGIDRNGKLHATLIIE
jgi:flagellar P-ring protein precursor FlgI